MEKDSANISALVVLFTIFVVGVIGVIVVASTQYDWQISSAKNISGENFNPDSVMKNPFYNTSMDIVQTGTTVASQWILVMFAFLVLFVLVIAYTWIKSL